MMMHRIYLNRPRASVMEQVSGVFRLVYVLFDHMLRTHIEIDSAKIGIPMTTGMLHICDLYRYR